MKKDTLKDGIGFIDDELIDEAEKASGLSYRAKIRLIRTLIIGAAAAAMITTAVLLHMNGSRKTTGNGGDNIVPAQENASEGNAGFTGDSEDITVTSAGDDGEITTVTAITSAGKTPEITTVSVMDEGPVVTVPEAPDEETSTTAVYPPSEFTYDKDGLFKAPENYSYAGDTDIVCVKFGNQYLRDRFGLWINCNEEQSDRNLDMVAGFELSDIYEEIGFTGGGFLLRVYYRDGTFMEYELYEYGIVDITDRSGNRQRWKDLSGNSHKLLMQLQSDQLAVDDAVSKIIEDEYGEGAP